MDSGSQGEVIFEDRTEARVAADLLREAGRPELIDYMRPPVNPPSIGFFELAKRLRDQKKGIPNEGIHRIVEPEIAMEVVDVLASVSNLDYRLPAETSIRKKDYMGAKLMEFRDKYFKAHPDILLGDLVLVTNVTEEQAQMLARRHAFTEQYFSERGWDINHPTMEQVLEVRSQPEWIGADSGE